MTRIALMARVESADAYATSESPEYSLFLPCRGGRADRAETSAVRRNVVWTPGLTEERLLSLAPLQLYVDARFEMPSRSVVGRLRALHDTRLMLGGLAIEHDEDPGWLCARISDIEARWVRPDSIALSVLPELKAPVPWLLEESGRYHEDFTLSDLVDLTERYRTMLDIHETAPGRLRRFLGLVPAAEGLVLHEGVPRFDGYWPALRTDEEIKELLREFLGP